MNDFRAQPSPAPVSLGEETEQVAFKESAGELKEAVISMAAILNKHGSGKVCFGVRHDGTVVGQETNDTTLRTISQAVHNHLKPVVYPTITKARYGNRTIVVVEFSGSRRPYLAYDIPRIRVADEDLVMEQPVYEEMMRQRDNIKHSWERQRSKYRVADVDKKAFSTFLKKAWQVGRISFESEEPSEVLSKLELLDGDRLLNAGASLFVDSGINELQMAKFASDKRLTITDINRLTGSIIRLSDEAVQYVVAAMDWRVEIHDKLERDEIPEVPVAAVREAVINAFAHWRIESGQSVEVAVLRSFIDIHSPGAFPAGMTPEMFIQESHPPVRRNPLITRTLYYSKDMEVFATGLKRIQTTCDEAGCKVEYFGDEYGFTVRFHRHCGEKWGSDQVFRRGKDSPASHDPNAPLSHEDALMILLRTDPSVTRKQISENLGVSMRQVAKLLESLKNAGRLRREGAKRGGRWILVDDKRIGAQENQGKE